MNKVILRTLAAALIVGGLFTTGCDDKDATNATETTAETAAETTEEAQPETTAEADEAKEAPDDAEEGGNWVASETYGVRFRVPEEWEVAKDSESISATDADGTTTIVLIGSESEGAFEKAVKDVKEKVELKEVTVGTSEPTVLNGLAGFKGSGTGVFVKEDMDQEIQFIAYSLRAGEKAITLMIFSEAEMFEAKKELILGIANTLESTE